MQVLDSPTSLEAPPICPCLAELFRTCVYPPSLHLHIEKVRVEHFGHNQQLEPSEDDVSSGDERKMVLRLFLSDGVLRIQALLDRLLLPLVKSGAVVAGNVIVLKKFRIRRAKRLNGIGEVVFLGISDCHVICSEVSVQEKAESKKRYASDHLETHQQDQAMPKKKVKLTTLSAKGLREHSESRQPAESAKSTPDSDSDEFETSTFDRSKLDRKRKALQELKLNRSFESQKGESSHSTSVVKHERNPQLVRTESPPQTSSIQNTDRQKSDLRPSHSPQTPSKTTRQPLLQQPSTHFRPSAPTPTSPPQPPPLQQFQQPQPQPQPPLHTLHTLLTSTSLPPKSYPCTIFAIISWISSTILQPRAHSPFPPKRHIKIHDPSISDRQSGVTVAVYCDAANFRPCVGTAAVFRGVVMQRTGGSGTRGGGDVILNAYERLTREPGVAGLVGKWFEDADGVLEGEGWDVKGLKEWWLGRERERAARRRK